MENIQRSKKNIEFIANNTNEAIELKNRLIGRGLTVNSIYTGSDVPILIDNGNWYVGSGNIRANYLTRKK